MDMVERYSKEFGYVFYLLELDETADLDQDDDEEPVSTQRSSIRDPGKTGRPSTREVATPSRRTKGTVAVPMSRRTMIETLDVPVDWEARAELERKFTQLVAEIGLTRAESLLLQIRARVEASID